MNFLENKELLEHHLSEALHVNNERVKKTVALCNYLDSEFYDASEEDEIQVVSHIKKQMQVIAQKMITSIEEAFTCKQLSFGYVIPSFYETYEGIFYIWGIYIDEEQPLNVPLIKRHPRSVSDVKSFIVMVDIRKGIEIIPWNQ